MVQLGSHSGYNWVSVGTDYFQENLQFKLLPEFSCDALHNAYYLDCCMCAGSCIVQLQGFTRATSLGASAVSSGNSPMWLTCKLLTCETRSPLANVCQQQCKQTRNTASCMFRIQHPFSFRHDVFKRQKQTENNCKAKLAQQ